MDASTFAEADVGEFTFQINKAGISEKLLSATDVTVPPGSYYTIVLRGFASPPAGNTNGLNVEVP